MSTGGGRGLRGGEETACGREMVTSTYRSVWSREEKNHRLCVRACEAGSLRSRTLRYGVCRTRVSLPSLILSFIFLYCHSLFHASCASGDFLEGGRFSWSVCEVCWITTRIDKSRSALLLWIRVLKNFRHAPFV